MESRSRLEIEKDFEMANPNGLTAEARGETSDIDPTSMDEWIEHLSEVYKRTFGFEPEGNDEIYIENIAAGFFNNNMKLLDPSVTTIMRGSADIGFRRINA